MVSALRITQSSSDWRRPDMSTCSHTHTPTAELRPLLGCLKAAEALCHRRGERWTPSRHRTYELLLRAGRPVKAYDLVSAYAQVGERLAKPPTVYRALDFLLTAGLVHRIESLNAFLACRAESQNHSAGFLICDCCGRVEELDLTAERAAIDAAQAHDFTIARIVLEAHGACAACR